MICVLSKRRRRRRRRVEWGVAACFAFTLVIASHLEIDLSRVPILCSLFSCLVLSFSKFLLPPRLLITIPLVWHCLSLFLLSLKREREHTHTLHRRRTDRPEREREMRIIWLSCNKFHSSSWAFWELKMVSQWRRRQFTQVLPSKRFRIRHSPAPDNEAIITL